MSDCLFIYFIIPPHGQQHGRHLRRTTVVLGRSLPVLSFFNLFIPFVFVLFVSLTLLYFTRPDITVMVDWA